MPNGFIVKMIPLFISATHNQVSLQTSMARIKVLNLLRIIFILVQLSFSSKDSKRGNELGNANFFQFRGFFGASAFILK